MGLIGESFVPQLEYSFMLDLAPVDLKSAPEVARAFPAQHAANGIRYASFGETQISGENLEQLVQAVPRTIATALARKTYYFVPLTLGESLSSEADEAAFSETNPDRVMIAAGYSSELSDAAICHRNVNLAGMECTFISTRLMQDRFALAFEFYINAGHQFVDAAGVPESFMKLAWSQAESGVRGETSQDAWEYRMKAGGQASMDPPESRGLAPRPKVRRLRTQTESPLTSLPEETRPQQNAVDEKARSDYFNAAFADAIAIYLLSLTVDFDYAELREREYPLLAAPALAERLRLIAQIFPPNNGYEFSLRYRRRER